MPLALMIGSACGPDKKMTNALATARSLAAAPMPADESVARSGATVRQDEWRSEMLRAGIRGKGGQMIIEQVTNGARAGLKLIFEDQGPGIPNIEMALKDGYSTGTGMGLGLGGSKRLVNEFSVESAPGKGTRVTVVRWK